MSGTKIGGLKAKEKNLKRDKDFYKKIGSKGGKNGHTGGFFGDSERAEKCGRIGAYKRWNKVK